MTRLQVRWWDFSGQFAKPTGGQGKHRRWARADLYAWAAECPLNLADRIPLSYWPPAGEPARYLGAERIGDSVALLWATSPGILAVVWELPEEPRTPESNVVTSLRERGVVGAARIEYVFGLHGPSVELIPLTQPQAEDTHLTWKALSGLIGQPLPYWPLSLRQDALLTRWRPDDPTVEALASDPELDTDALLRMASLYESDHPAARVLLQLARTVFHRESKSATDVYVDTIAKIVEAGTAVLAARPIPVPAVDRNDVDETTRRLGWLEILSRRDALAEQCVLQLLRWDNGADSPFGNRFTVSPGSPIADEWIARLKPIDRTAAFRLIDDFTASDKTLLDPATDAPVLRKRNGEETKLRGAAPQRLPATSPLDEIILDDPIWVRTSDGTLYPAPQDSYWGLSWGYAGSGPGSLALLIHRLLDDINAPAADSSNGAPAGLERLTQIEIPRGTILSRKQLESARTGTWRPTRSDFPEANDD